ncbi:50S ribosomal protein L5 [Patescibacteria group bacterium AH-259-L05]|nr:50S ribosomal protein L5 [Patescibacteria group bacterium AH-259-L05]
MSLRQTYQKEIIPAMQKKFGYTNALAVPKIEKVTVNVGINRSMSEKNPKYIDLVIQTIQNITGQKPVTKRARKSIAGFKIRNTTVVGVNTVLRASKMYDFLEKLINVTLPRIRDFRGLLRKSVDANGNLSIGFKEQIMFPEINPENVVRTHGLQVVITTTAKTREEAIELFKLFGVPFRE